MPKVSQLIVRIWSAFLALIFLAVSILGIIAIVMVKQYRGIGVGILIFGLVGLGVAIAGLAGAGFEKNAEGEENTSGTKIKVTLLVLFFAVMVILHVLFMIFGVSLICVRSSVKMLLTLPPKQWNALFNALPEKFRKDYSNAIEKMQNFALGLGIALIVISVIILVTCLAAAYQMGKELSAQFFMASFAIVEIIIGFALAIFLLILNASHNNVFFGIEIENKIIVPIVIFGFGLAIVGFIGFAAIFIGHKYKVISVIFIVGNIIVLVAFIVLLIFCLVFNRQIVSLSSDLCWHTDSNPDPCQASLDNANANMCPQDIGPCYTDTLLKNDAKKVMQGFTIILAIVCLFLVLFLLIVTISTCVNCFRPTDDANSEEKRPLYASFY